MFMQSRIVYDSVCVCYCMTEQVLSVLSAATTRQLLQVLVKEIKV